MIGFIFIHIGKHSIGQQKSYSEDYQIKMWKKFLKKCPLPENSVELEKKFSFPSKELMDKDVILWSAEFMATDSSWNIYVSDARANRILKFDSAGQFLKQIGQKGKGPGELLNPRHILIIKNSCIVNDTLNGRIQFFDENGKYVKTFKVFKGYYDIVVNDNGLIYATPLNNQPYLIDVLSKDGQLLYSFGRCMRFKYDQQQLNFCKLALNKKGELFVAFTYFPIVRKYSQKGKLLAEFRINHKAMKFQEEINLKRISARSKGKVGYVQVISAIKVYDDNFYILHNMPRIEILEFDNGGRKKSIYWYVESYDYTAEDFLIQNRGNEKIFYLLTGTPDNTIDVFKPRCK